MSAADRRICPAIVLIGCLSLAAASSSRSQFRDLTSEWQIDRRDVFAGLDELSNANLVYNPSSEYPYGIWFSATMPIDTGMPFLGRSQAPPPPTAPPPYGLAVGEPRAGPIITVVPPRGWLMPPDEFISRAGSHSSGPYRYRPRRSSSSGSRSSTSRTPSSDSGSSATHSRPAGSYGHATSRGPSPAGHGERGHRSGGHAGGPRGSYAGKDPIYHAHSTDGVQWEVYAGDGRWTTTLRPWAWEPVVDHGEAWYDNEYAAHPSVVCKDGTYYMVYSALGLQRRLVEPATEGYQTTVTQFDETTDGLGTSVSETRSVPGNPPIYANLIRACIMGAASSDGIHWEKTPEPIAIAPREYISEWGTADFAYGVPREFQGAYQRPCLMFDEGRWRLWYAYYLSGESVAMGYRENPGDFMNLSDWDRGFTVPQDEPLLEDWPNPSVVRVFDKYLAFSDRGRYTSTGNRGRITVAESDDGLRWRVTGSLRPESPDQAVGDPEACFTEDANGGSIRLFYSRAEIAGRDADIERGIRLMKRPVERRLMTPQLVHDWGSAVPIADTGSEVESFSLFGRPGRWVCMAVEKDRPETLFIGMNDRLTTAFKSPAPAAEPFLSQQQVPGGLGDAREMRGLFVRLLDPLTPLLCYGQHMADEADPTTVPRMQTLVLGRNGWEPHDPERSLGGQFLFEEEGCRDPMVLWDPERSLFVMYYVGARGGVQARTSPDLLTWSEPLTVVACPSGYGTVAAPFAVQKQGYYYLFVSSEDHTQMAVYASLDPLNFGDAERDMLTELPGHAPEIVRVDGVDHIACCSIRHADGTDQKGIYVQELDWVE